MTAEEFLIQQWNKCIWMVHEDHPSNIVMLYDKQHERKLKLNSLEKNDEINFIKTNESKLLFYQDYKNGYFRINYNEIWSVLEYKYNLKYKEVSELIRTTLLEDNKLKNLTTTKMAQYFRFKLLEDNKLKQLIPHSYTEIFCAKLLEDDKFIQL